ncbi:MAG: ABC transporter permease, partial [Chloroflexi bacterium]|nr:ABC transporter permease [Chloroflexota bacterium]
ADLMFAGIVTFGVLGFLADRLFALAQQRVFWRYQPGR